MLHKAIVRLKGWSESTGLELVVYFLQEIYKTNFAQSPSTSLIVTEIFYPPVDARRAAE